MKRHSRPIACVGPTANGAAAKKALRAHPRDRGWIDELRALRAALRIEEVRGA